MFNFESIRFKEESYLWEDLFLETISLYFPDPQEFLNKTNELLRTGKAIFSTMPLTKDIMMQVTIVETWESLYEYLMEKKD